MGTPITIVHITDVHIKAENASDVKRRVSAFNKYALANKLAPDLLILSGDLAYHGTEPEYRLFEEVFLKPVSATLRLSPSRILMIPGNHDVHRDSVTAPDVNKRDKRTVSREGQELLLNERSVRLSAYYSFADSQKVGSDVLLQKSIAGGNAFVRVLKLKGIRIGIACLNTAWQCADENDKNHLLLTEAQVSEAIDQLGQVDLKIAVCHHPGDWLLPDEAELALQDLKRDFDLVLSGHLHNPESHYHLDPTAEHLWFVGRAFFDGKVSAHVEDGFHFYELDLVNKSLQAHYRKFVRKRNTFAADTDHADNGTFPFKLPIKRVFGNGALVVHRLAEQGNALHLEIRKELSLLQDSPNPVIVTPKICGLSFQGGERKRIKTAIPLAELIACPAILYGPPDSGKSILLKGIAADNSENESTRIIECGDDDTVSVYVRLTACSDPTNEKSFLAEVGKVIDEPELLEPGKIKLRLLIDDVRKDIGTVATLIDSVCRARGWSYVLAIGNELAVNALGQSGNLPETKFFEILPWGPSKIKELAQKLFENTGIDVEVAFKNIQRSLAAYDLPANPTTVSLYMSLMAKGGAAISGVSFLRLLELIEEKRIGASESLPVDTKYYRQQSLCRIAVYMLESTTDVLSYDKALEIITDYLRRPMFEKHAETLLQSLIKSGLLVREDDQVQFVNYVFLDYFIARSIGESLITEELISRDLRQCVRLAQALALFAGMKRENTPLAERILGWIEERFPEPETRTLKDLDAHVKTLLAPKYADGDVDKIVEEDLARRTDLAKHDDAFEERRTRNSNKRKQEITNGQTLTLDELSAHTASLHTFYGVLKNLETIDGERKIAFLNRILDFHIRTNFYLIGYFRSLVDDDAFRTVVAYLLTWSGHKFMAASLGSQALCDAIKACIRTINNDFKELLLILLLSDLRDSESLRLIKDFSDKTESVAATEILFIHLRYRMIEHEKAIIPTDLVVVFRAVFERRQRLYSKRQDKNEMSKQFDQILRDTKNQHAVIHQSGITQ